MRRFLAVVGAAAMVMASLAIRARLDAGGQDPGPGQVAADRVRVMCAAELAAACRGIAGAQVEPAGTTADRLAALPGPGDAGLDAWIVPVPWPELVNERRRAASLPPLLQTDGGPVARSRLALAVSKPRAAALAPKCPGGVTWKCIGEAAADGYWSAGGHPEWGRIKPGHAEPDTDAVGLLVLGQAVSGYFGRPDLSTIDLETDDAFARWFAALERAVPPPPPGDTPLNRMLVVGPAAYDAAGTTDAEASQLRVGAGDARVELLYPEPMATADVVIATSGRADTRALRRSAGAALAAQGWASPAAPGLPPANGLPSGGLLLQLQSRWHGVTGR